MTSALCEAMTEHGCGGYLARISCFGLLLTQPTAGVVARHLHAPLLASIPARPGVVGINMVRDLLQAHPNCNAVFVTTGESSALCMIPYLLLLRPPSPPLLPSYSYYCY